MASPTWFFDGDKKRIYEVPPGAESSYTVDGSGYRVYGSGAGIGLLYTDVKKDIWSRWIDWMADGNDWSVIAFNRSGGALRGYDELSNPVYQSVDFQLRTSVGWKFVLANYPHETIFKGNLFTDDGASLFDNSRLTMYGIVPRMQGAADLLTYNVATGGGSGGTGFNATELAQLRAMLGLTGTQTAPPTPGVLESLLIEIAQNTQR